MQTILPSNYFANLVENQVLFGTSLQNFTNFAGGNSTAYGSDSKAQRNLGKLNKITGRDLRSAIFPFRQSDPILTIYD
jgi:hypothetical protein